MIPASVLRPYPHHVRPRRLLGPSNSPSKLEGVPEGRGRVSTHPPATVLPTPQTSCSPPASRNLVNLVNYIDYNSGPIPYTHNIAPSASTKWNAYPPAAGGFVYKIYKISRAPCASRRIKNKSPPSRQRRPNLQDLPDFASAQREQKKKKSPSGAKRPL